MTKLDKNKRPRWRETETTGDRGRALLVALSHEGLRLRSKGLRTVLVLPWGIAFARAAMLMAASLAGAKKQRRKTKRGAL